MQTGLLGFAPIGLRPGAVKVSLSMPGGGMTAACWPPWPCDSAPSLRLASVVLRSGAGSQGRKTCEVSAGLVQGRSVSQVPRRINAPLSRSIGRNGSANRTMLSTTP